MKHLFILLLTVLSLTTAGAQESGDVYDPFVDYSEFDGNSDEEADINFFQNGRQVTLGLDLGYRTFTGNLGSIYDAAPAFGINLTYFFDLRFAMTLSYLTGSHDFRITPQDTNITPVDGSASMDEIGLKVKYYLNTQNMTRGIAKLNPFLIGGFTNISRNIKTDGQTSFNNDKARAISIGAGFEIPVRNDEMFIGAQVNYRLVNFKEENQEIRFDNNTTPTGIVPTGDSLLMQLTLGFNF